MLLATAAIFLAACAAPAGQPLTTASATNAKLDSTLNQLVAAAKAGRSSDFAAQNSLELVGGRVRVIIECLPGQGQAVSGSIAPIGLVETAQADMLQVLIPIEKLSGLAGEAGIRFVRIPLPSLQDTAK
jgi:hypothetical protein